MARLLGLYPASDACIKLITTPVEGRQPPEARPGAGVGFQTFEVGNVDFVWTNEKAGYPGQVTR